MNILLTLNFEAANKNEEAEFQVRDTARAVIFDDNHNIALMKVAQGSFHKLPGGGIDQGETPEQALVRECREEAGVEITDIKKIGLIREIKKSRKKIQNSHCYVAYVVGAKTQPQLTESEKKSGFEVLWLKHDDAIQLIRKEGYSTLDGRYISERELAILVAAKDSV